MAAGFGLMMVLGLAVARWQDLLLQYYSLRLAKDDHYFRASLDEPKGTVLARAVQQFLESPSSTETLVKTYILEIVQRDEDARNRLRASRYDKALICLAANRRIAVYCEWDEPGWASKGGGYERQFGATEVVFSRLEAMQRILATRRVRNAVLKEYPDAEFSFLPTVEISGDLLRSDGTAAASYACFVSWPKRTAEKYAAYRVLQAQQLRSLLGGLYHEPDSESSK